jgi:small GTP-binding protein
MLMARRKLARLRAQLLEPGPGAGGTAGTGFDVSKSGDARIALVGFPSVGKSTFLSKITKTKSEIAAYSFTTLTAIPGVLEYGGAEIQILDLPGIIEGAAEGKGRGRQVISAAKTSDMIVMVLDATKRIEQRALLEAELEAVGIRLNQDPPNIYLKQKKAGGMKITFSAPPKKLDEKMLYNILRDYKILNCEVLVRDENGMSFPVWRAAPSSPHTNAFPPSNRRSIHRCDHEGSSNLHQMPLRVQQNRQRQPRISRPPGTRTQHGRHEL